MEQRKENRPKLKIDLEPIDFLLESIGIIGLLLLIGLPIYYYGDLPATLPSHFNAKGEPDAFSGKGVIWPLSIIGTIMYVGMAVLNRFPHTFNYPVEITRENAERQYKNATRMIRMLNTIIVCVFAYIIYGTIQVALAQQEGLGGYFLPVMLVAVSGTIGYFLYRSTKNQK